MSQQDAPGLRPVLVTAAPAEAAAFLLELLVEEYGATAEPGEEQWTIAVVPVDRFRRGTCIYRVIQASRTVAERFPDSTLYLITEDGNHWRLPPPAL